jgi:4a-hydroxytetrahydrobiopterin dehydratase
MSNQMPKLSPEQIEECLAKTNWKIDNGKLFQSFSFPSYMAASEFVQYLATLAEELNHHPDILFSWKKVSVWIFTHDVNGITTLDTDFISLTNEHYTSLSNGS